MNADVAIDGSEDVAIAALLHPFATQALTWPESGRVLFARARDSASLRAAPRARFVCEQQFKPFADALSHAGLQCVVHAGGTFPLVLLLPPRQRLEARSELVRAVLRTDIGGTLVACAANNEGARSHEADMRRLCGSVHTVSKHHCRVFWTILREGSVDRVLLDTWSSLDAPRSIVDGRFLSRPGVFAWDRIDAASELLAAHLPDDLSGRGADLGAGYGYLSVEILALCARVNSLDVYEADARALDLARTNIACANEARNTPAKLDFLWHDVTTGLRGRYDFIVTNPPFHVGRADLPELGRAFIASAADALDPDGRLWLVANRHLPYETELRKRFSSVRCVVESRGFKVIEAAMVRQARTMGDP
ncbi:MAG TPA: class I SAM-dependent methyltransferase [Xanthomonadaceae bacterium]|nr:class I SAM-dependent methyltransferase [Xanthomonadaceae bacterium]